MHGHFLLQQVFQAAGHDIALDLRAGDIITILGQIAQIVVDEADQIIGLVGDLFPVSCQQQYGRGCFGSFFRDFFSSFFGSCFLGFFSCRFHSCFLLGSFSCILSSSCQDGAQHSQRQQNGE